MGVVGISHNVNLIVRIIKFCAIVDVATQLLNVVMEVSAAELQRKDARIILKNVAVRVGYLLPTVKQENSVGQHLKWDAKNMLKNVIVLVGCQLQSVVDNNAM